MAKSKKRAKTAPAKAARRASRRKPTPEELRLRMLARATRTGSNWRDPETGRYA